MFIKYSEVFFFASQGWYDLPYLVYTLDISFKRPGNSLNIS